MDIHSIIAGTSPIHPEYEDETKRLMTFTNPSSSWPMYLSQKPADLAHAGFVYRGYGDEVYCFWCNGTVYRWEKDEIPLAEHAKFFPKCEYIKKIYTEKIKGDDASPNRTSEDPNLTSTEQDKSNASTLPKSPEYENETRRLKTFTNNNFPVWLTDEFENPLDWADAGFLFVGNGAGVISSFTASTLPKNPEYENLTRLLKTFTNNKFPDKIKNPLDWAHAGFVYVGTFMYCFWCGGQVWNWEGKDIPLLVHAKLYPDCEYIRKIYISKIEGNYYSRITKDKQGGQQDGRTDGPDLFLFPHVMKCLQSGYAREEIQAVFDEYGHEILDSRLSLMMALDFHKQPQDEQTTEPTTANIQPFDDNANVTSSSEENAEQLLSKEEPAELEDSLVDLRLKATCMLCKELYTRPRVLTNCSHVFCYECIKQYLIKKQPNNFPPCPICRKPIIIRTKQDKDLSKLKVGLAENDIVDFIKPFEHCHFCRKRERPTFKCIDCDKLICKKCQSYHPVSHTYATVLDLSVVNRGQCLEECGIHKNQSLDLYCLMCDTVLCVYCEKYLHAECTKMYDDMQTFITKVSMTSSCLFELFLCSSQERNDLLGLLKRRYKDTSEKSQEIPPMVLRIVHIEDFSEFSRRYLGEMNEEVENDIIFYKEYIDMLDSLIEEQSTEEQLLVKRKESLQNEINVLYGNGEALARSIRKLIETASNIEIAESAKFIEKRCILYFKNRQSCSLTSRTLKLELEKYSESKIVIRQRAMANVKKQDESLCFVFVATVELSDKIAERNRPTYSEQTMLTSIKCFAVRDFYKIIYSQKKIPDNSLYTNRFADGEEERNIRFQMACSRMISEGFTGDKFRNIIEHRCIVSCKFDDEDRCIYVLLKAKTTLKTFYYRTGFVSLLSALPLALRNDCIYRLENETISPDLICLIGSCNKTSRLEMLFIQLDQENGFTNGVSVNAKVVRLMKTTFPNFQIEMKFSFLEDKNKGFSFVKAKARQNNALIRYYSKVENIVGPEQLLVTLDDGLESPVPIHRITVDLLCETTNGMCFVKCLEDTQTIVIGKLTMSRVIKKEDIICSLSQDDIRVEIGKLVPITITETRNNDIVVVCSVEYGNFLMILPLRQTTELLEIQYPSAEPLFKYSDACILDFEMDCDGNIMYVLKDDQGEVIRVVTKYILP